jgi:hypothetical protein
VTILALCWTAAIASAESVPELSSADSEQVAAGVPIEGERAEELAFFRTEFRIVQGYRGEEFDWSISVPGIDVLSELEWEDLRSGLTQLEATVLLPRRFYLRSHVQHGWIRDGENQDSDYLAPGRTAEFSRSNNGADRGDYSGFSVGIGYRGSPIHFARESYVLAVVLGYAHREQNLVLRDGVQTLSVCPFQCVPLGPFSGLRSKYDASWFGPWVGIEVVGRSPLTSLIFTAGLEYHRITYEAVADWNLRTDFAHPESFNHDARGEGIIAHLGLRKDIGERFFLEFGIEYTLFSTEEGDDRTNFSDGTFGKTTLNEVNWEAFSALLGFGVRF